MDATPYSDQFFDQQAVGSLASARIVLQELFSAATIGSVVDVGCGVAPWLRAAIDLGAQHAVGLDGSYVDRTRLMVEPARFHPCDLEADDIRQAVQGMPFDLAMCLEVAEHLPAARAPSFIAELCGLGDLVLFSAAVPNQGGTNHVNEQWPGYWAALFADQGFACFDVLRPRVWDRDGCEWWYVQNTLLFARHGTDAFNTAQRLGPPCTAPAALVHPRMLAHIIGYTGAHIGALEQVVRNQPFERDATLRTLEAKVDRLRTMALEQQDQVDALTAALDHTRAERDQLRRENDAFKASTSWRVTGPLRRAARLLRR